LAVRKIGESGSEVDREGGGGVLGGLRPEGESTGDWLEGVWFNGVEASVRFGRSGD